MGYVQFEVSPEIVSFSESRYSGEMSAGCQCGGTIEVSTVLDENNEVEIVDVPCNSCERLYTVWIRK